MATLDELSTKADALTQALADAATREQNESAANQATIDKVAGVLDAATAQVSASDQPPAAPVAAPVSEPVAEPALGEPPLSGV